MTAIAAVGQNWGLGKHGQLLFHIPEDLHRFRKLTLGGTLILGRKTLESLPGGRPLPGRTHVVFTRDPHFTCPGAHIVHSAEELTPLLPALPQPVHVVGGAEIYALLLPLCSAVALTQVEAAPPADCFFPPLDTLPGWVCTDPGTPHSQNGLTYRFTHWERR